MTEPRLEELKQGMPLILKPAPNGGWVVSHTALHPGEMADMLGAFSSAQDMLEALTLALMPELAEGPGEPGLASIEETSWFQDASRGQRTRAKELMSEFGFSRAGAIAQVEKEWAQRTDAVPAANEPETRTVLVAGGGKIELKGKEPT